MHWNHRIVDLNESNGGQPWFEVREVFYEDDGSIMGHGEACFGHEDPGQIVAMLQRMIDDINRNPAIVKTGGVEPAGARLIAAAPDLLAALQGIMAGVAGCQKDPQYEAARAAIANAMGGQP